MRRVLLPLLISLFLFVQLQAQKQLEKTLRGYNNPDELITLSPEIPFSHALELLSKVSESTTGKKIVSTVIIDTPIGLEIKNMAYDKALLILVQYFGLIYEEKEDIIVVKRKAESSVDKTVDNYASVDSREVKISAVFFEMDVNKARQQGIDWKLILTGRDFSIGGLLGIDREKLDQQSSGSGTGSSSGNSSLIQTPDFRVTTKGNFTAGNFFGEATAAFQFFENEDLGEIIASPNISVRDRKKGRIQVGSDFSIKQRDFSGNIVENFFSTGSIIEVTPFAYNEEDVDYILLDVNVERSSFIPDELTTEIRKSQATTQVILLNGEETVLGGLFVNEETKIRSGIPFLKDLPWWVFGLRYIFGSEETRIVKKELVILIKAEIIPTLKDRHAGIPTKTPIKDEVNRYREKVKYYQFKQTPTDEK